MALRKIVIESIAEVNTLSEEMTDKGLSGTIDFNSTIESSLEDVRILYSKRFAWIGAILNGKEVKTRFLLSDRFQMIEFKSELSQYKSALKRALR